MQNKINREKFYIKINKVSSYIRTLKAEKESFINEQEYLKSQCMKRNIIFDCSIFKQLINNIDKEIFIKECELLTMRHEYKLKF